MPGLSVETQEQMRADFDKRLEKMLHLVARGRGIELLIRIVDQTREGLAAVKESYEVMMTSDLRIPNTHPPQALPRLFDDPEERDRIELARKISDKLAHGLYRQARKPIREYRDKYGLRTKLNSDDLPGWRADMAGHLIEEDGRKIESIVDTLASSADNLTIEEFDVFVHNNYEAASLEIIEDAWRRLTAGRRSLATQAVVLHMSRGFKRGVRTYLPDEDG